MNFVHTGHIGSGDVSSQDGAERVSVTGYGSRLTGKVQLLNMGPWDGVRKGSVELSLLANNYLLSNMFTNSKL